MKKKSLFKKTFFLIVCFFAGIIIIAHLFMYLGFSYNLIGGSILSEENKGIITIFLSMGICFGISNILAFFLAKIITEPVIKICKTTEQMKELEDEIVCKIDTEDELAELAGNINGLYEELRETIQQLEKESSDRKKLEILKIGFEKENEDKKKYIENSWGIREEQGENLPLSNVILETVKPYLLIAKKKRIQVELKLESPLCVNISPAIFKKIVENIFFYAIYNTNVGKKICLSFQGDNFIIQNECTPFTLEKLGGIVESPLYGKGGGRWEFW